MDVALGPEDRARLRAWFEDRRKIKGTSRKYSQRTFGEISGLDKSIFSRWNEGSSNTAGLIEAKQIQLIAKYDGVTTRKVEQYIKGEISLYARHIRAKSEGIDVADAIEQNSEKIAKLADRVAALERAATPSLESQHNCLQIEHGLGDKLVTEITARLAGLKVKQLSIFLKKFIKDCHNGDREAFLASLQTEKDVERAAVAQMIDGIPIEDDELKKVALWILSDAVSWGSGVKYTHDQLEGLISGDPSFLASQ